MFCVWLIFLLIMGAFSTEVMRKTNQLNKEKKPLKLIHMVELEMTLGNRSLDKDDLQNILLILLNKLKNTEEATDVDEIEPVLRNTNINPNKTSFSLLNKDITTLEPELRNKKIILNETRSRISNKDIATSESTLRKENILNINRSRILNEEVAKSEPEVRNKKIILNETRSRISNKDIATSESTLRKENILNTNRSRILNEEVAKSEPEVRNKKIISNERRSKISNKDTATSESTLRKENILNENWSRILNEEVAKSEPEVRNKKIISNEKIFRLLNEDIATSEHELKNEKIIPNEKSTRILNEDIAKSEPEPRSYKNISNRKRSRISNEDIANARRSRILHKDIAASEPELRKKKVIPNKKMFRILNEDIEKSEPEPKNEKIIPNEKMYRILNEDITTSESELRNEKIITDKKMSRILNEDIATSEPELTNKKITSNETRSRVLNEDITTSEPELRNETVIANNKRSTIFNEQNITSRESQLNQQKLRMDPKAQAKLLKSSNKSDAKGLFAEMSFACSVDNNVSLNYQTSQVKELSRIVEKCVFIKSKKTGKTIVANNINKKASSTLFASKSLKFQKWNIENNSQSLTIGAPHLPFKWVDSSSCSKPSQELILSAQNLNTYTAFLELATEEPLSNSVFRIKVCKNWCVFVDNNDKLKTSTRCNGTDYLFYITRPDKNEVCTQLKSVYIRTVEDFWYLGISEDSREEYLNLKNVKDFWYLGLSQASKGKYLTLVNKTDKLPLWNIEFYPNYTLIRESEGDRLYLKNQDCEQPHAPYILSNDSLDESNKFDVKIVHSPSIWKLGLVQISVCGKMLSFIYKDFHTEPKVYSDFFLSFKNYDIECPKITKNVYIRTKSTGAYLGVDTNKMDLNNQAVGIHKSLWNISECGGHHNIYFLKGRKKFYWSDHFDKSASTGIILLGKKGQNTELHFNSDKISFHERCFYVDKTLLRSSQHCEREQRHMFYISHT